MKTLLTAISILLTVSAHPATVELRWANNPADQAILSYQVFEQVGPSWTLIGHASTNLFSIGGVAQGIHTYAIIATNAISTAPLSVPVSVIVPAMATPVTNITVIIRAESSSDPSGPWQHLASLAVPYDATAPSTFFRSRLDIIR